MSAAYAAIAAEAERLGWPAIYRRDLTEHDRVRCAELSDDQEFFWCVGECGTMIVLPSDCSRFRMGERAYLRSMGRERVYHWDGSSLTLRYDFTAGSTTCEAASKTP